MLARRIILGFGFAVLLPLLVHYGIEAFHPSIPASEAYVKCGRLQQREKDAVGDEKATLREARERCDADLRTQERASSRTHFFVGAPLGIVITLAGSLVATQAIGGGLMLGGIFTFSEGCFYRWADLDPVGRLLVLLVAFGVLLWIGYQRVHDLAEPRHAR
jgi:hypothetical protein